MNLKEKRFWKALEKAFDSKTCKFLDFETQYDVYGAHLFCVFVEEGNKNNIVVSHGNPNTAESDEDWFEVVFHFEPDTSFTANVYGKTITGTGYDEAAEQYVLNVANKLAVGEYSKEYKPECYSLWVNPRRYDDKVIHQIEEILEYDDPGTYTYYEPYYLGDEGAYYWEHIEKKDMKKVIDFLVKGNYPRNRFKVLGDGEVDVTSKFMGSINEKWEEDRYGVEYFVCDWCGNHYTYDEYDGHTYLIHDPQTKEPYHICEECYREHLNG